MVRKYSPMLYKEKIQPSNNKSSDHSVTYERNNISGLEHYNDDSSFPNECFVSEL